MAPGHKPVIPEIGHFALALALAVALAQGVLPLIGAARGDLNRMRFAATAAQGLFALVALGLAALTYAHVTSDFTVLNVKQNSHHLKPLLYKISGVWGNHEGSMVLWVFILSLFGFLLASFGHALPARLKARTLAVQGLISAGFLAFILFSSNPFIRLFPPPLEGDGLNPILQDPGLAFHPPLLYFGYVGFSIVFSFAAAALIEGRVDETFAHYVRPWVLMAWSALTLGIALGSWWAYYELGWGGFWAWDPVENASLMPWLAGTALLHSVSVLEKRGALRSWTVFLAILAFSLSLLGTFLVRSGVLTSVHAFATDPARGIWILSLLGLAVGGAIALFAWRAPALEGGRSFGALSRESLLLANNLLLTTAAATILLGTLYPLILDALTGAKITVGPPFFAWTFAPLVAALCLILPLGAQAPWKEAKLNALLRRLAPALIIADGVAVAAAFLFEANRLFAALWFALAIWLIGGSLSDLGRRARWGAGGWAQAGARLARVPLPTYGFLLAHIGLGVLVLGVAGVTGGQKEALGALAPGEMIALGPYVLKLDTVELAPGPDYVAERARIRVTRGSEEIAVMHPARRFYPVQRRATTEAAIRTNLAGDLYVVLGEGQGAETAKRYALHAYINPLAPFIWIGAAITALGGLLSLAARRRAVLARVGLPAVAALPAGAE
jgi:cytochrome c-type biogenesis protein CcmF